MRELDVDEMIWLSQQQVYIEDEKRRKAEELKGTPKRQEESKANLTFPCAFFCVG